MLMYIILNNFLKFTFDVKSKIKKIFSNCFYFIFIKCCSEVNLKFYKYIYEEELFF